MSVEVHSRTAIIKGHPKLGIPQGSNVFISSRPTNHFVRQFFKTEEPEISLALDPGKYTVVVRFRDPEGPGGMRWQEDFFVDCNEETYEKLAYTRPQLAKTRQTSKGIRFICGYVGCKMTTISRLGMVEHEAWHQGMSVLKNPDQKEEAKHATLQAGASQKKKEKSIGASS